jgi:hypothetical protein
MPNGYTGKILHVDLTRAKLEIEEPIEWVGDLIPEMA